MTPYEFDIPQESHLMDWLHGYGEDGAAMLTCTATEASPPALVVTAGWGRIEYCPICGDEISVESEEVEA